MTIEYMQAVWQSDVPSPERFTLLALADQADDYGYCWPSTGHLVRKCRSSERTVQRHVETLRSMGVLRVDHARPAHPRERGTSERQRTNGYTIDLAALAAYRHRAGMGVRSTGVSDRHPDPRQSDTPTPVNLTPEPIGEPTGEPTPSGGERSARPGEQADLGLDVKADPPPARKRRDPEGAQAVVAVYAETYAHAHGRQSLGRDRAKIGRDARAMVRDGESLPELIEAARTMGRDGRWNDLGRQVALDRTGGRPPSERGRLGPAPVGRPGKFDDMPEEKLIDLDDRAPEPVVAPRRFATLDDEPEAELITREDDRSA